jgi:hypothetical protein
MMKRGLIVFLMLAGCGGTLPRAPDTIYRPRTNGTIDLGTNPNAHHCSDLTKDFRDAYGLEASVKTVLSIAVPSDASSMTLRTNRVTVQSSLLIGDDQRLRAFWYYDDWTLAVVLDHGNCRDETCAAEIALIKYNGARSPTERPSKLCFERWVGTFTRVPSPPDRSKP